MREFMVVLFLCFFYMGFTHPLHLSVSNLEFKNDSVFFSIRVFTDDFNANLLTMNNSSITHCDSINSFAVQYIKQQFKMYINEQTVEFYYLNTKTDHLSVWYYFSGTFPVQVGKITIENRILTEYFNDQKNLVIIKTPFKETGLEFNSLKQKIEFSLEK